MRFLLLSLFIVNHSLAQITVTTADMPNTNDIKVISIVNPQDVTSPELTGTNYTWDFSTLNPLQQRIDTFMNVTSTPLGYQFYFNNFILYPDHMADYGVPVATPNFIPQLNVQDVINYYRNTSGEYVQVGFGANVNGVPMSVRYIPTDTLYLFPLNYGNTNQNSYFFDLDIPGLLYYGQTGTRVDTVDGWGTVITPFGSFNALRVKSTIYKTDTTYINTLGFGTSIDRPVEVEYKWLANGQGVPVFQVNTTGGQVTSIEYLDVFLGIGIAENEKEDILIYPNPTEGIITIEAADNYNSIEVYDQSGRLVYQLSSINESRRDFDLSNVEPGLYHLILRNDKGSAVRKIVVK